MLVYFIRQGHDVHDIGVLRCDCRFCVLHFTFVVRRKIEDNLESKTSILRSNYFGPLNPDYEVKPVKNILKNILVEIIL